MGTRKRNPAAKKPSARSLAATARWARARAEEVNGNGELATAVPAPSYAEHQAAVIRKLEDDLGTLAQQQAHPPSVLMNQTFPPDPVHIRLSRINLELMAIAQELAREAAR